MDGFDVLYENTVTVFAVFSTSRHNIQLKLSHEKAWMNLEVSTKGFNWLPVTGIDIFIPYLTNVPTVFVM